MPLGGQGCYPLVERLDLGDQIVHSNLSAGVDK